jgi:hypothetical protein|tara:strand:- start:174 stop:878 length:705 start_codon:yes stop_codon:yes gene_type:complete
MEYNVRIGSGKILEGSVTGEIHFHFNKNGLVVEIPDTEQYFNKKNINGISFKTQLKDKVKKGSSLAKTAAFMAAANKKNKNVGQQIAMSQRFADMGRDTVIQEEISIGIINIKSLGDLVIDFGSDSGVQKNLVKAYNNPKSFFTKSLENSSEFSKNKKSNKFWWIYWIVGLIFLGSIVPDDLSENEESFYGFLLLILISIYPIYQKIKNRTQGKSIIYDFKKSEEYKKILKNLS